MTAMSHSVTAISSIRFPADAPAGTSFSRQVLVMGATPVAPEVVSGVSVEVEYAGHVASAPVAISFDAPTAVPTGRLVGADGTTAVQVTLGDPQPVSGYADRWTYDLTVTKL